MPALQKLPKGNQQAEPS